MPRQLKSPCLWSGCAALVEGGGYCVEHEPAHHPFYKTKAWRQLRAVWIAEHPLCGEREHGPSREHSWCVVELRTTVGTVVDHIRPIRLGGAKLDRENLQTLCSRCNTLKTARELRGGGELKVYESRPVERCEGTHATPRNS
jgi:5-methylcytosine-specific restriction enzyme A